MHRAEGVDQEIVSKIRAFLDENNKLVKKYRMTSEILKNNRHETIQLRLI